MDYKRDAEQTFAKQVRKKTVMLVSIQCDAPIDGGCSNGLESMIGLI